VLALGQVLADVPEGFAAIADFRDKGVARPHRLLLGLSFTVPALVAASLAYLLLRDQSEALRAAGVVFTAGLLTVAAVEDMMAEAHASAEDTRASVLAFVGGFVLFTLVSAGLGG
jgi:zinc transporter, ZIP family